MVDRYQAGSVEAAKIIIADPSKYPPGSLLGKWAAVVLLRARKDGRVDAGTSEARALHRSDKAA